MKEVIKKHDLDIDWGYDMWKWDLPHFQITKIEGFDARRVYDFRELT